MKVLVVGGGMAGLTYAIISARNGNQVVLCERNARVGKKISATGNGKCNIGNLHANQSCYNPSPIVQSVLQSVSVDEYLQFLSSCQILTYADETGRLYPLSDSASNVVDCLRHSANVAGVTTLCDTEVLGVERQGQNFVVNLNGTKQTFQKVVLAMGSGSGAVAPKISNFVPQNYLTEIQPSLCPVKVVNMDKTLNGIRAKANVSLLQNGQVVATESGEVQFKDYGLSGICIFNLSAVVARTLVKQNNAEFSFQIDLVPSMTQSQLANVLASRTGNQMSQIFYGILHNKLAESVVKSAKDCSAESLAFSAKNFTFSLQKLLDWSMSQVTCGGISASVVEPQTLTLPNGLVALGEMLDVDGKCGGFNLFFAGASAIHTFTQRERQIAFGG